VSQAELKWNFNLICYAAFKYIISHYTLCKPFPIFSSHQMLVVIVVVPLLCLQTIG